VSKASIIEIIIEIVRILQMYKNTTYTSSWILPL